MPIVFCILSKGSGFFCEKKAGQENHKELAPLVNLQKNAALHCLATCF
jgi:hypothetical protein